MVDSECGPNNAIISAIITIIISSSNSIDNDNGGFDRNTY